MKSNIAEKGHHVCKVWGMGEYSMQREETRCVPFDYYLFTDS